MPTMIQFLKGVRCSLAISSSAPGPTAAGDNSVSLSRVSTDSATSRPSVAPLQEIVCSATIRIPAAMSSRSIAIGWLKP